MYRFAGELPASAHEALSSWTDDTVGHFMAVLRF